MTILFTILAFLVALGILIVFHEFGHYLVARWCGVRVLRFSIGFGRPLLKKRWGKDQTEWVIAAFPIGGYVKMLDEREGEVAPKDLMYSFNGKSVTQRFAIVVAGPVANFLLAILLYWAVFMLGITGMKPIIGTVIPDTPAASSAFEKGDTILRIGTESIATWEDARWMLLKKVTEKSTSVEVESLDRNGKVSWRELDLSRISADDLEINFLQKLGLNNYQPTVRPFIAKVSENTAASRSGLLVNDEILMVNGKKITLWEELIYQIQNNPKQSMVMEIRRNSALIKIDITPDAIIQNGKTIGRIGIEPQIIHSELEKLLVKINYPASTAAVMAVKKTWDISVFTLKMLWRMVEGNVSWKNLSGPIVIADYAGKSAQIGLASYCAFLALISISLGVLNLLPIPLLDGGHLMYYVIEIIKGSPLSEKIMGISQQIGMMLLFILMILAMYNDINRFISN